MTQEEGEFQGGVNHSEELSASLARRDETADLGFVPIDPFLKIVKSRLLMCLVFLGCPNRVAARWCLHFFLIHCDFLRCIFLSAKPTYPCSSSMKGIIDN